MKGYQLIEPNFVSLLIENVPLELAIAMMHKLVFLIKNDSTIKKYPIEIDLIIANYHGNFPSIAVHYLDKTIGDIEPLIEKKLLEYYSKISLLDFHNYVTNNWESINKTISELKEE